VSRATQPIPLVEAYFGTPRVPIVVAEFSDRWRRQSYRKRISRSWARKLKARGVTHVTLALDGREADFSVAELLAAPPTDYERGWRTGLRAADGSLERADGRGEPDAWYHGYLDAAAGREKWHIPRCAVHHNGPGGCGQA
jgi:hypothetical protein